MPFERIFKLNESLIAPVFIQLLVTTGKLTKARAFAVQCELGFSDTLAALSQSQRSNVLVILLILEVISFK